MGKQFTMSKPRAEGDEKYGTGDFICQIEEVDLDHFQNDGWTIVTDRDVEIKHCDTCNCDGRI